MWVFQHYRLWTALTLLTCSPLLSHKKDFSIRGSETAPVVHPRASWLNRGTGHHYKCMWCSRASFKQTEPDVIFKSRSQWFRKHQVSQRCEKHTFIIYSDYVCVVSSTCFYFISGQQCQQFLKDKYIYFNNLDLIFVGLDIVSISSYSPESHQMGQGTWSKRIRVVHTHVEETTVKCFCMHGFRVRGYFSYAVEMLGYYRHFGCSNFFTLKE